MSGAPKRTSLDRSSSSTWRAKALGIFLRKLGPARVLPVQDGDERGLVRAQAHYAVFRTRPGDSSEVYNVGRYIDEIVRTEEGLKFRSRRCTYDSEMVLNSLIYPI